MEKEFERPQRYGMCMWNIDSNSIEWDFFMFINIMVLRLCSMDWKSSLMTETLLILLLQNFSPFKLTGDSEHSVSEFYYPGKQSDAEQLQFPTYSESREWKSTLLTNEEVWKMKWKQNKHMIKWSLTEWHWTREENSWLLVQAKYFTAWPSQSVNKYILLIFVVFYSIM